MDLPSDILTRHRDQGYAPYLPLKCHRIYLGKEGKKNINILLTKAEAFQFINNMQTKLQFMIDEGIDDSQALRLWHAGGGDTIKFGLAPLKKTRRKKS